MNSFIFVVYLYLLCSCVAGLLLPCLVCKKINTLVEALIALVTATVDTCTDASAPAKPQRASGPCRQLTAAGLWRVLVHPATLLVSICLSCSAAAKTCY